MHSLLHYEVRVQQIVSAHSSDSAGVVLAVPSLRSVLEARRWNGLGVTDWNGLIVPGVVHPSHRELLRAQPLGSGWSTRHRARVPVTICSRVSGIVSATLASERFQQG